MKRSRLTFVALLCGACGTAAPAQTKLPPPPAPSATAPAVASAVGPDRVKLPEPSATPAWALGKPQIFALSNGMKVYYLEQGPTPLVSLLLVFPNGSATDPKGKAGLTTLTADLLDEGAGKLSSLEMSEALQRLGTDYGASTDVDSTLLVMNTIADTFADSTKLLSDIVRRPKLDAKEFARRKEQRLADALSDESEPSSARSIVMRKALFGDGYGGNLSTGTRPTLKKITHADVRAHYRSIFAPEGAALVVVGGIDQQSVAQSLEAAFGDWKGAPNAKPAPVVKERSRRGIFFIDFPGATQSALALARHAPGESASDYFPAMAMSRVLGEAFTSRLNMNLREDKGYTYGARSSFRRWKDAGYFGLAASVKRETTRASIDETIKELADVCTKRPIDEKERAEAVGGLLLGFPGRFERGGDVAGQLASLPLYGRADDWLEKWPDRVKAITLAEANAVAKEYCNADDYVIVVAGDRKVVEPSFAGLDRKLFVFDAQGNPLKK